MSLMRNPEKTTYGLAHPRATRLAVFEFDLDDLQWLSGLIPPDDGFSKDIQDAIKWLLEATENKAQEDDNGSRV